MAYYYPYYSYIFLHLAIFKLFKPKILSGDLDSLPNLQYQGLQQNQH